MRAMIHLCEVRLGLPPRNASVEKGQPIVDLVYSCHEFRLLCLLCILGGALALAVRSIVKRLRRKNELFFMCIGVGSTTAWL